MGRRKIESESSQEVKAKRSRKQKDHADANNNENENNDNEENNNNEVMVKTENNDNNEVKEKREDNNNNNNKPIIMKLDDYASILVQNMPKWHEISNYFNDEDELIASHDSHTDSSSDEEIKEDVFNLKKSNFTDLIITTNDQRSFAVHTLLLIASCEKFRAELLKIRKETNKNFYIQLESVSGQEFVWMLEYVYSGQVVLKDEEQQSRFEFLLKDFGFVTNSSEEVKVKEDVKDDSFTDPQEKNTIIRIGKGGKCVECDKHFTTYFAAKKHFELKHTTPVDPSKFTCSICGKTNSHQFYLDRHMREKHGVMKRARKSISKGNSKEN